jgi:CubicO group peptidase (beta-lactamase class C family)
VEAGSIYYPPSESAGGWRYLSTPEQVRELGGISPEKLDLVLEEQEQVNGGDSWGVAIIRHGYLVREHYTFNVLVPTRFDVWSCTKSFCGTVWGLLLEDCRQGRFAEGKKVDMDSPAYVYLPEGYPLSDLLKEKILIRHLLTMTSAIPGEGSGVMGIPTSTGVGAFEHALGHFPNRYGRWADKLIGEPGSVWNYSDPAIAHLALIFKHITGREMDDYFQERICQPIGIENMSWDIQGGSGFIGPHTNAHTGVHISAREFARFGYLMLHKGLWEDQQILADWWVELATRSSQPYNPSYGYTWWVNTQGLRWPSLPKDTFAASGYRSNRCYVIPSLDLVIVRVGSGPTNWDENLMIGDITNAIIE